MSCYGRVIVLGAGLLLASMPDTGNAQTARSGAPASSQLQLQMQQLASDKARLDAENAKLKKDLDDARKELESLKKSQKDLDARAAGAGAALAQSKTQHEVVQAELNQTKGRMEQLVGKFRETAQSLKDAETEKAAAKQTLAVHDQQLRVCSEHNASLYQLNQEVVSRLEHEGFWSRAAASEPFTRLKRTENENLADDYKARAQDQRVTPPASN